MRTTTVMTESFDQSATYQGEDGDAPEGGVLVVGSLAWDVVADGFRPQREIAEMKAPIEDLEEE